MTALELLRPQPETSGRGRRMLQPLGVAAAAGAVLTTLAVIDPNQPGHYPTCPWLFVTGTWCPGCGTLRALHDLTHADVAGALARNPLTVVMAAVLLVWFGVWVTRLWRGRQRSRMAPPWVLYGLFWVVVAFWALRNVPGWTWLSPA